jgi:hypothetical protein
LLAKGPEPCFHDRQRKEGITVLFFVDVTVFTLEVAVRENVKKDVS